MNKTQILKLIDEIIIKNNIDKSIYLYSKAERMQLDITTLIGYIFAYLRTYLNQVNYNVYGFNDYIIIFEIKYTDESCYSNNAKFYRLIK